MTLTSIVMATYNGIELTKRCVTSVFRHTDEPFEFIFVDNGSSDGTPDFLEAIPGATVIRNEENRGYAAACNQGMAVASGTHIVLLNNDTIVTPAWLTTLTACLDRDPSIGIVGPVSNNVAPIQRVQAAVTPNTVDAFADSWRFLNANAGFYAHRLIGFCMLFRRDLLDEIGGMDERFFPGNYEDDDFSIRARIRGKRLWVAKDAFIYHEGSGTFKANNLASRLQSVRNAEKFRAKWSIAASPFEIDQLGYNPSDVVSREPFFIPERHYIPLPGKVANQ